LARKPRGGIGCSGEPLRQIWLAKRFPKIAVSLLNFDFGAGCFELSLKLFCFFLGDAFLEGSRSALNKLLSVSESETGDSAANFFNDRNLVAAVALEDDVEFGLFFSRSSVSATTASCGDCYRCCSAYAPLFFEGLNEVSDFQYGKAAETFYDFFDVCHGI
jgi:hypothetical protein